MSELTRRILFAVPAAIFFLWVTRLGGLFFEGMIAFIVVVVIWEISNMMKKTGTPIFMPVVILIAGYVWFLTNLPWIWVIAITVILLAAGLFAVTGARSLFKQRILSTLFTGVYAVFGLLMIVQIRSLGTDLDGFWLTLSFFLMVWGNDVFAYFGGKAFGRRKLAPILSPNKTWEGFFFGFLGAATGYLIAWVSAPIFPLALWGILPASVAVSVMGPRGDSTESSLKRRAGVKDASNLLPGHGGFFDRFDSMILAAPFIYFIYYFMH